MRRQMHLLSFVGAELGVWIASTNESLTNTFLELLTANVSNVAEISNTAKINSAARFGSDRKMDNIASSRSTL